MVPGFRFPVSDFRFQVLGFRLEVTRSITITIFYFLFSIFLFTSCSLLEPDPIDLQTDDIVLNEARDVPNVEIGLYAAFRPIIPAAVIAGI